MWLSLLKVLACAGPSAVTASSAPENSPASCSPTTPPDTLLCAGLAPADGFDFPVGPPEHRGYRDVQPFGQNQHLGGDWNGAGGGSTDFGDPVYAVADGRVSSSADYGGGWGTVLRIVHWADGGCVESLYAHLSEVAVAPGDLVHRGQRIGAIGDAHGRYSAHLHLELRVRAGAPLGAGYGEPDAQVDPTAFIEARRPP